MKGGTRILRIKLSCVCLVVLYGARPDVESPWGLFHTPEPSEGQKPSGSAGLRRAIHLAALRYSVCAEKAVQEDRGQFCYLVPVDSSLGHAIDRTHSCGLSFRVLHDLSDRLSDIL